MFCKTTKSKVDSKNLETLEKWIKKKWEPLISDQAGFRGYYFAAKPSGDFVIIILWKEENNAQDWTDNSAHQALVPEFMSLMVSPVEMDLYEVKKDSQNL
ncbi:MAG: antibiotic biosynthesis monooxygenase [Desulfobacterales bacterium]|nr:antibiotic biosynthesis monooxygenase [Desulfobacterales bacterium]